MCGPPAARSRRSWTTESERTLGPPFRTLIREGGLSGPPVFLSAFSSFSVSLSAFFFSLYFEDRERRADR